MCDRFEFDESRTCNLAIKRFDGYTEEWARFVLDNRENLKFTTPTVQYFFGTEQAVKLLKKL